jgi:hypothetical protein
MERTFPAVLLQYTRRRRKLLHQTAVIAETSLCARVVFESQFMSRVHFPFFAIEWEWNSGSN